MDIKKATKTVTKILNKIINENVEQFRKENSFKVRPGYGYDKFYLDWIDGSYDMSLQGLIHYIMYEEGIYREVLNDSQYADVKKLIADYPESKFSLDRNGEEDPSVLNLQYQIEDVYAYSIKYVGEKLVKLGFEVNEHFDCYFELKPI